MLGMSAEDTYDSREVRWWNTLVQNIIKADILEERMSLDLFCVGLSGAQTTSGVTCQQLNWTQVNSRRGS